MQNLVRKNTQYLVHEYANRVSELVGDVLFRSIHVVRAEHRILEAEHFVRRFQIELERVLRNAWSIFRIEMLFYERLIPSDLTPSDVSSTHPIQFHP